VRHALVKILSPADEITPPYGLGYLAPATRAAGHDPVIVDALKEGLDEKTLVGRLASLSVGMVGVLLFSKDLVPVRSLFRALRLRLPGVVTVVGGPHPSAVPEDTISFFGDLLDYAFVGESESGLPRLLAALEEGRKDRYPEIPGLVWRDGDGVRVNPKSLPEDVDSLEVAWDLIPPDTYPRSPHGAYFRQFPVAPIVVTRGCPFHCTFCAAECVSGRRIRRRSVGNVIGEIRMLRERYGVREIHVEDDNFTGDRAYVGAFCEALSRECPGTTWTCPNGVRLDTLDRETLRMMKASGLYFLSVGIESGSDRVLSRMRKSLDVSRIEEKVRLIHESGIGVSGFFMLGFPGETREEMEETVRLALRLPLSRASFANFQPFPGCEEYRSLRESGRLTVDWERFAPSLQSTSWSPDGIPREELRRFRKKALLRFYARPAVAWGMIREIRSIGHAFHVARRGWRWLTIPE
jgi:radical SAM superfamily enzyme YgiQ (UPF0313 family)